MSQVEILIWSDIRSETRGLDEYLQYLEDKPEMFNNYQEYHPQTEFIEEIRELLAQTDKEIKILAIGASWCHDCAKQVPRMTKIIEKINAPNLEFRVLYGVKVKANHRGDEVMWHKRRSPPEATDPKFGLSAIPTFFFFINEKYTSRVVEGPEQFSTLEEELLQFFKEKL